MKIYLTKYALTNGIEIHDAKQSEINDGAIILDARPYNIFFENDYTLTKESAIAKAEEIKEKKLNSLQRQIDKLRGMEIKIKGEKMWMK